MILTQTPLRVSLFGGGSDYAEFFLNHPGGGAVLGMAINKFCYVGLHEMHPGQDSRFRVQYSKVDDCQEVVGIKHPAVRAALLYYGIDTPLELHCFGEMPGRGGLGSSSSFCVGLLKALQHHFGIPKTDSELDLASEAVSFERHMIPEAVGFQDQTFAAVGGLNYITFGPEGTRVERLNITLERRRELEQSLMLVYAGGMRDAHQMAQKQISRIPVSNTTLTEMVEMARAGRDVISNPSYPIHLLGGMLHEAWLAKVALCPEVTSPAIEALYDRGLWCGALGGKLLGAGGGGYFLFFVPPSNHERFALGIGASCVRFRIADTGSRVVNLEQS